MIGGIHHHQIDSQGRKPVPAVVARADGIGNPPMNGRSRASSFSPVGAIPSRAGHLSGGLSLQGLPLLFSNLVKADRDSGVGVRAPAARDAVQPAKASEALALGPVPAGCGRKHDRQFPGPAGLVGHRISNEARAQLQLRPSPVRKRPQSGVLACQTLNPETYSE
jgi:hypothetical protein